MLETGLVLLPRGFVHAGMIRQCVTSFFAQPGGRFLDLAFRQAVNDAALVFPVFQKTSELSAGIILFHDRVADIGTIETRDEGIVLFDIQMAEDLGAGRLVCCCRQRHARRIRKMLDKQIELAIGRTEVVPPLRKAVSLVDSDQRQINGLKCLENLRFEKGFRRSIENIDISGAHGLPERTPLFWRKVGVECLGPHAGLPKRRHLIDHQRDQRRDDQPHAFAGERRNLVTQ